MGGGRTVQRLVEACCNTSMCCSSMSHEGMSLGVNNIVHSSSSLLKFGIRSVPMLSTTPLDPLYSIAKSLIFVVTVNPKLAHPPRLTELPQRICSKKKLT